MIIINADELPRFMICNGSRLMPGKTPASLPVDMTARDEGTAAHYMGTAAFMQSSTVDELIDRKAPNGTFMTSEMAEHATSYLELMRSHPIVIGVEYDTSHDGAGWAINGRCDFTGMLANNHLRVIDFKYGYRIVEPDENWTLISHAIGILKRNQHLNIEHISLTIFQPRPYHPDGPLRTVTMTSRELNDALQTLNLKLVNPSDQLRTNDHCGTCHSLASCPAARLARCNAIDATSTVFHDDITNDVLSQTLETLERAEDMIKQSLKAFEEMAKHRIKGGQVVTNYGVETSLGNSKFNEGMTADILKMLTGIELSEPKLVTPAEAKRRGVNADVIKSISHRPITGTKLVRVDVNKKAARLFEGKKGS